jgi:hypothetical protein
MSNTLDKVAIDELIELLKTARTLGFEALSSPVDVQLEAAIDVMLLLRASFKDGNKYRLNNPGLKFSETEQDSLGNPKQIKIQTRSKVVWDPDLAEIFNKIATFLVLVKNGDPTWKGFFDRSLTKRSRPASMAKAKETAQETKLNFGIDIANRNAGLFYHRRQRKRSFSKYSDKDQKKKEKNTHQPN